jgi:hypothetical protein
MNTGRFLSETGLDSDELLLLISPIKPDQVWLRPASPLMMKLWGSGVGAITLGNWIFVDPEILRGDKGTLGRLVIHELVHVRQWADLGPLGFLSVYVGEYVGGRRRRLSHRDAYLAISLETEARQIQASLT